MVFIYLGALLANFHYMGCKPGNPPSEGGLAEDTVSPLLAEEFLNDRDLLGRVVRDP